MDVGNRRLGALGLVVFAAVACHGGKKPGAKPAHSLLADDPVVVFHATQPMVVDVEVALARAATVHVALPGAAGVRIADDSTSVTKHSVRVRGLEPGHSYVAKVTAGDGRGATEDVEVPFKTIPPLPGYIPSFKPKASGRPAPDYRIFDLSVNPLITKGAIYAIDADGKTRFFLPRPAKTRIIPAVPAGIKLRDDGSLLFVQDDHAYIVDELGTVLMDLPATKLGVPGFHHDIIELPNGHFMTLSYSFRDETYAFDKKTHHVAGDLIVEFDRAGHKLWTWDSFDYLDPKRIREDFVTPNPVIDPANGKPSNDWTHGNALLYSPADDSVLVSMRHQDWIIKIDHKTGKVRWKLGEDGDFKLVSGDRWFFHQHSPELEPDGGILMYDNGAGNPHLPVKDRQSRPLLMKIDEAKMTASIAWQETKQRYMVLLAGDADRLENGDVNVLDSFIPLIPGTFQPTYARIREVDPKTNEWVWSVDLPDGRFSYRCIHSKRLPGERRGAHGAE